MSCGLLPIAPKIGLNSPSCTSPKAGSRMRNGRAEVQQSLAKAKWDRASVEYSRR